MKKANKTLIETILKDMLKASPSSADFLCLQKQGLLVHAVELDRSAGKRGTESFLFGGDMEGILKKCQSCYEEKPINHFHKSPENADGRCNFCRACRSIYRKDYYSKNKKREGKNARQWQSKHRDIMKTYRLNRESERPWINAYYNAKARCQNPNNEMYKWYGAKGIKFLMTEEDFKFLWIRDNAELMIVPSIDRINHKGDYVVDNCQFLELVENVKKSNKQRKDVNYGK